MVTHYNIDYTLKHGLCTGCGLCEGACPQRAITIECKNGRFIPSINSSLCNNAKGCYKCVQTCGGLGIDLGGMARNNFASDDMKSDPYIGYYLRCFTGYSCDEEIRYRSASGGMVTQFLIFLLDRKNIDGAVVTRFDPQNQYLVNTFIATTRAELISARSSKYSPVSFHGIIQEIKNKPGKYVVVGLPCHIHSFRKYELLDKQFKSQIFAYFGIYCSSGRTFYLTEAVFRNLHIPKNKLTYFAYRDMGCLGNLYAEIRNEYGDAASYKKPFQQYYHPLRSFFVPRRCLSCIDHYAELADASFGDIHKGKYLKDKVGISSMVIRNERILDLLIQAQQNGYVVLEPLDTKMLNSSQPMIRNKKHRTATVLKIERLRGRGVPQYGVSLADASVLKSTVSYFLTLMQMIIGRHRVLWPFIKLLKKDVRNIQ